MNKYIKMCVLPKTNYFLLQTNSTSSPHLCSHSNQGKPFKMFTRKKTELYHGHFIQTAFNASHLVTTDMQLI